MKNQGNQTTFRLLRQKAEDLLGIHASKTSLLSAESELQKLVQELKIHQIELEMQNEELMLAKEQAETANAKYTELYEFTPSG